MCCIFTCCGWMIDLLQRLWTFTMSCCISSAVCCTLLTGSMSGVALGYNYSLAEYIDLKETNVSIFLKRGIFDDDISQDHDFRRSGNGPLLGHVRDENLITASDLDETSSIKSGRRLDESIFGSNDKNNFEGSLMKLTAKPPYSPTTENWNTPELHVKGMNDQKPSNQLQQLKEMQSIFNARKMAATAGLTTTAGSRTPYFDEHNRLINDYAIAMELQNRRRLPFDVPPFPVKTTIESLRKAVPNLDISDPIRWAMPHMKTSKIDMATYNPLGPNIIERFTYPQPITLSTGPARPTKSKLRRPTHTTRAPVTQGARDQDDLPRSLDEEIDIIKHKEKYTVDNKSPPPSDFNDMKFVKIDKSGNEDYEEDVRGVPLRKRRECATQPRDINSAINNNEKISNDLTMKSLIIKNDLYTAANNFISKSNKEKITSGPSPSNLNLVSKLEKKILESINKTNKELIQETKFDKNVSDTTNIKNGYVEKNITIENSRHNNSSILSLQRENNFTSSTLIKLLISSSVS